MDINIVREWYKEFNSMNEEEAVYLYESIFAIQDKVSVDKYMAWVFYKMMKKNNQIKPAEFEKTYLETLVLVNVDREVEYNG